MKPTDISASPKLFDDEGGDISASLHSSHDVCLLLSLSHEAQREMVVAIFVVHLRSFPVSPVDTWHHFDFKDSLGLLLTARLLAMVKNYKRSSSSSIIELIF